MEQLWRLFIPLTGAVLLLLIYVQSMRDYRFYTYIVGSNSGTLYTGFTNNIELRVWQHKNGVIEGFTKKYGCHRLLWFEEYDHVVRAINREKQIKGWRRSKKIALIESRNPRWKDLAENWGKKMIFANQSLKAEGEK